MRGYASAVVEPSRAVPVVIAPEVAVVGGGPAGLAAALAAARTGADVLLIERYGFLGGAATTALVAHFDPIALLDLQGIPREIYDRLKNSGTFLERDEATFEMPYTFWESGCAFDPEVFKFICLDMLEQSGVTLLLHSLAVSAIVEEAVVTGVIL